MELNKVGIKQKLHHRDPYLMVDKVTEISSQKIHSIKDFSNVDFIHFGHFPGTPVVPGAMLQELCTQSAGILMTEFYSPVKNYDSNKTKGWAIGVLNKVESAKYLDFVDPQYKVNCEVKLLDHLDQYFRFKAKVIQEDKIVAKLKFCLAIVPDKKLPNQ